uniref:Uncharacterized protein n=1 Tax=viral metagenome TaxID=1070528 RepID=A0A6C0K4L0_9ZZZZ
MSSQQKTYQNVSIAQLLEWSQKNPNRGHELPPIQIQAAATEDHGSSLKGMYLPTYSAIPVSNPIGIFAWIRDPMFADASASVKNTIIRDLVTKLQTDCETLAGSRFARKRRRIIDGIGAVFHGLPPLKDEEFRDVLCACAHLSQINLVFVRDATQLEENAETKVEEFGHAKGSVSFSSNPSSWSRETPIWLIDSHGRWLASPVDDTPFATLFLHWLDEMGSNGWIIEWPQVDATKDYIVEELKRHPTWKASDSKLLKGDLAIRLGRIQVLQAFSTV